MPIHLLQIAKKLANDAGKMALKYQQKKFSVSHKTLPHDLFTEVDKACEDLILKTIKSHFPDHSILSEESEAVDGTGDYKWIIDPIDGTSNFAHGIPIFAISIAVVHKGKPIIGVVEIPGLGETFWAQEGKGAFIHNKPIHVSKTASLEQALLTTGFPYEHGVRYKKTIELFDAFYTAGHGVRRFGSAAMDLCFVAAGRFDGFWEYELQPWDVAAGKIILEEAGGMVTNMDGSTFNPKFKNILASNGLIHSEMMRVIASKGAEKI